MPERTFEQTQLHGGVSDQPEERRFENQWSDGQNMNPSVKDGARDRHGTRFVTQISGITAGTSVRLHGITRDAFEQYLVVIQPEGLIRVLDTYGTEATVNVSSAANVYLTKNCPTPTELVMRTSADFTFIVNRTVKAKLFERSDEFTIQSEFDFSEYVFSQLPLEGEYYRSNGIGPSPSTAAAGVYRYIVATADNGFATWERNEDTVAQYASPTSFWARKARNPAGFKVRLQRQVLNLASAVYDDTGNGAGERAIVKAGAFTNYTFQSGDKVQISGPVVTDGYYAIASKASNDAILLSEDPGADDTLTSGGSIAQDAECNVNFFSDIQTDMHDLFLAIQTSLRATGHADLDGLICQWVASSPSTGHPKLISPYRGAPAGSDPLTASIVDILAPTSGGLFNLAQENASFSNVPFRPSRGTFVAGSGLTPSTAVDADPESRWALSAEPGGVEAVIDEKTMPVKMVRTSTDPLAFDIDVIAWKDRVSGDENSNPAPEFLRNETRISDVAIFQDRLAIGADEFIAFSRIGDITSLYLEDVNTTNDADRFEIELGGDDVSIVEYLEVFRTKLLVFTKAGNQFDVNSPDVFTASTATRTQTTSIKTIQVRPVKLKNFVYALAEGGERPKLFRWFVDEETTATDADEVSAHFSSLVPSAASSMLSLPNDGVILIFDGTNSPLFYKAAWNGSENIQRAACKWLFPSSYTIHDAVEIAGELHMVVEESGGVYTHEFMTVEDADPNAAFQARTSPGPEFIEKTGEQFYVFGGTQGSSVPESITQEYWLEKDCWSAGDALPTARWDATAVSAAAGSIWVQGGQLNGVPNRSTANDRFDKDGLSYFTETVNSTDRGGHAAASIGTDIILTSGDTDATGSSHTDLVQEYDTGAQTFSTLAVQPGTNREDHAAESDDSNDLYTFGGESPATADMNEIDKYDKGGDSWSNVTETLDAATSKLGSFKLDNTAAHVLAGERTGVNITDHDIFTYSSETLAASTALSTATTRMASGSINGEHGFAVAGVDSVALSANQVWDDAASSWTTKAPLTVGGVTTALSSPAGAGV